ncbi:MAG: hypothetical protein MUF66_08130, partial [Gammaproteobacteria bacterium]|nr:hypothetical protein [Gammaproteobacteria bacterium]
MAWARPRCRPGRHRRGARDLQVEHADGALRVAERDGQQPDLPLAAFAANNAQVGLAGGEAGDAEGPRARGRALARVGEGAGLDLRPLAVEVGDADRPRRKAGRVLQVLQDGTVGPGRNRILVQS